IVRCREIERRDARDPAIEIGRAMRLRAGKRGNLAPRQALPAFEEILRAHATCTKCSPTARLERRPTAKAEELFPVEGLLGDRYSKIEADRSKGRGPQNTDADRRVDEHTVGRGR